MTDLGNGYKIIFRNDTGENAHPIPGSNGFSVEHYNIEVQTDAGNTKYDLHIESIEDENGDLIDCKVSGAKKK